MSALPSQTICTAKGFKIGLFTAIQMAALMAHHLLIEQGHHSLGDYSSEMTEHLFIA
jgi:hypothetical protein